MTMALCMNCGNVKFGAICPCSECGIASTGDMSLDIAFSDHHLDLKTLEELGQVVRALRATCQAAGAGDDVAFWSFISYVSSNHPSILTANPPPELATRVDDVLRRTTLPTVVLHKSHTRGISGPETRGAGDRRRWWQFWKRGG